MNLINVSSILFRFQLPIIAHSSGIFDSWIANYHEALHLPEDIRPSYAAAALRITYTRQTFGYQGNSCTLHDPLLW